MVPAEPRKFFYHGSDKAFRVLGLLESAVVCSTAVLVFGGVLVTATALSLRALEGAKRLRTNVLLSCFFVFSRSGICAEHATFVFNFGELRQNALQYL